MVLAFVCAHPQQTFGRLRNVEQVAPLRSELVPAPLSGRRPLELRPYQMECLKAGMAENTIVCLDTGLGKTPIAVKLVDHFLAAATEASDGSKVLFIVPTVVLVEQQARVCRQYSANARCVTELCGNRLGGWTQASWDLCIQTSDVLVGTPAIFADAIITRGYLDLSRFSLIVFDEVHNATGNSPMASLMNDAYWAAKDKGAAVPHILGLTASFVAGAIDDLAGKRQALETLMDSQIFAPEVPVEYCGTPTFHTVAYLPDALENYQELASDKVDVLLSSFEGEPIQVKDRKKIVNHAAHVLVEGGMSAFLFYLGESVAYQLQGIAQNLAEMSDENAKACRHKANELCKILPELRRRLKEGARGLQEDGQLTSAPFVSAKARRLLELVEDNLKRHASQAQYKGIVFVEQVALSFPLAYLLNQHFERPDCVGAACGVRADVISGVGTMSSSQRSAVLERFKKGEVRILVATAAIEEGLDVSDCQFVVRYSHFNVPKSHIQGTGRARHRKAEIYYFENSPDAECFKAAEMKLVAQDPSLALCEADRTQLARESLRSIEGFYPFGQGSDGGVVNIYNCVQIFTEYCSKVMGQGLNLRQSKIEVYRTEKVRAFPLEEREYLALVRYPSPDGYQEVSFEDVGAHWGDRAVMDVLMPGRALESMADKERHRFLYTVVVRMRLAGYLTDANQPSPRAIVDTKAAVAAISAPDEFNILDRFAPDALDQRFGSSVSISAPALEPDMAEAGMPPPPPTTENHKGKLMEKAVKLWKTSDGVRFQTQVSGQPPTQIFQATVTLLPLGEDCKFTGAQASTKIKAEQAAAAAAMPRMDAEIAWPLATKPAT
jgi:endoribonuclease Dicer